MRLVRYSDPSFRGLAPLFGQRSPWSGLEGEIGRWFETALNDFGGAAPSTRFPVNLYEDKDNTYVRAELPGVNREDINVEIVDGTLTISATRKPQVADPSTASGQTVSLSRSICIGDEVQTDKVAAVHENGLLTITLHKREEVKPRKITVAVK